ncbi:MAG: GNAT family N-acetyltransferase [Sandaracinaceae bacterium]
MEIRQATNDDVAALCAADRSAVDQERDPEGRRGVIRTWVGEGRAYLAVLDGALAGYTVFEHSFFGRGFVSMLMVDPAYRRRGVGSALVRHVEGLCESERIFTSTNQSNLPMQSLLAKLGYRHSGTVEDLDPGDPELFYSRQLR